MNEDNAIINKWEYNYIDYLKVFFAITIVLHHICISCRINNMFISIINFITQIAVPYYFVASAFFLFKQELSKEKIIRYIKRILTLYFFWTITLLPFRIPNIIDIGLDFKELILYILKYIRVILFIGEYQLWYLIGTIWALLMILILQKIKFSKKMIAITALAMFILMQIINLEILPYNIVLATLWKIYFVVFGTTRNGVFVGFIYMTIGLIIAQSNKLQKLNSRILGIISIVTLVMGYILYGIAYSVEAWFVPVIVACVFLWSINMESKEKENTVAKTARKYSTLVYVSHMTVLESVLRIGKMNIVVECIIVLGLTFVVSWIITRLSQKAGWLKHVY